MENIVINVLAKNNEKVKVGTVYKLERQGTDIIIATFSGVSGKTEYYMRFDEKTKEVLTFHKNIRKTERDDRKHIKEEFWKKWKPTQFCAFETEEKLKRALMKDLDNVLNNKKGRLEEIDWTEMTAIPKGEFDRSI